MSNIELDGASGINKEIMQQKTNGSNKEIPAEDNITSIKKHPETPIIARREITVSNNKYRVNSVFADKIRLSDALKRIAIKKQGENSQHRAG